MEKAFTRTGYNYKTPHKKVSLLNIKRKMGHEELILVQFCSPWHSAKPGCASEWAICSSYLKYSMVSVIFPSPLCLLEGTEFLNSIDEITSVVYTQSWPSTSVSDGGILYQDMLPVIAVLIGEASPTTSPECCSWTGKVSDCNRPFLYTVDLKGFGWTLGAKRIWGSTSYSYLDQGIVWRSSLPIVTRHMTRTVSSCNNS